MKRILQLVTAAIVWSVVSLAVSPAALADLPYQLITIRNVSLKIPTDWRVTYQESAKSMHSNGPSFTANLPQKGKPAMQVELTFLPGEQLTQEYVRNLSNQQISELSTTKRLRTQTMLSHLGARLTNWGGLEKRLISNQYALIEAYTSQPKTGGSQTRTMGLNLNDGSRSFYLRVRTRQDAEGVRGVDQRILASLLIRQ